MPHPSSLACTTAAPVSPPAVEPPSPLPATKRRGNPNLALVPRCGARTRAGCPCRAPAIHGKLRCSMHGGRSTGPRTPEGRARVAAARTTHGGFSAETRAFNRHHLTVLRRSSVRMFAVVHREFLPPEFAARISPMAPELRTPPEPTRGLTRAEDRAMLQTETAALAPWKQAIALARQARRPGRAVTAAPPGALTTAQARPLAPELVAEAAATTSPASPAVLVPAQAEPHAPIRPASTRAASPQALGSTDAQGVAGAHASNRAARRACSFLAPARLAARPRDHAPERAAGTAVTGPAVARAAPASARSEPLAPIPPAPARGALDQAPASVGAEQAAKPHAPEPPERGASDAQVPARLAAQPKAHAPERTPQAHSGSRTISAGRAARRWLRQQKLMHQNQPARPRL